MVPTCQLCGSWGEASEKGQWPLPAFLSGRTLSPSSCLDARHISFSLYTTVPFKLLPQSRRSEGVSVSKSMCGFFKRNCLGLLKLSSTHCIPASFCSQKLWGLTFLAREPWAGDPGVGQGSSLPRYSSRIFIHHTWVWDQPVLRLCASNQSGWMWFL